MASQAAAPAAPEGETPSRRLAFRLVLVGLILLVVGFTSLLVRNTLYPCVPAADSVVQPPLAECATALAPEIAAIAAGLVIAAAGYFRVG